MGRFTPLPKWAITTLKTAFYDFESLTVIEQTGRLYKTIEDLINDYNKFVDELQKYVNNFVNESDKDYEEYIKNINRIIHDYIRKIDEKIKYQDSVINDAINYMKTNLGNTLQSLLVEMRESGELSEDIMTAFSDFTTRLIAIETDIPIIKEDINSLKERATTLETNTLNLDTALGEMEERLTLDETNISNLELGLTNTNTKVDELEVFKDSMEASVNELENNKVNSTDVYVKGDYAYLTGTILTETPTHEITYPEGFNKDNCVVLTVMLKKSTLDTACWTFNTTYDIISQSNGAYSSRVILYDDYIKIFAKTLVINNDAVTVGEITDNTDFKIILMKIS